MSKYTMPREEYANSIQSYKQAVSRNCCGLKRDASQSAWKICFLAFGLPHALVIQGAAAAVFTMVAVPEAWSQLRTVVPCPRITALNFGPLRTTADAYRTS